MGSAIFRNVLEMPLWGICAYFFFVAMVANLHDDQEKKKYIKEMFRPIDNSMKFNALSFIGVTIVALACIVGLLFGFVIWLAEVDIKFSLWVMSLVGVVVLWVLDVRAIRQAYQ